MRVKRITSLCAIVTGMYSSFALAAPQWEPKSYSGGVQVCHKQVLFESKWWAGSYDEPDPNGPTASSQPGWGTEPWLPLLESDECSSGDTNKPPQADAGVDFSVQSPAQSVVIDGSGSHDADGDTLSYQWHQISGPTVVLTNANQSVSDFILPSLDEETRYTFELTVNDGKATSSDQITVTGLAAIIENQPPVANAGPNLEIQSPNDRVVLDGSGSTDQDGDELTFEWQQVSGPAVSLDNAQSSVAHFALPELESDTEFVFQLTVNDGQESASDTMSMIGLAAEEPVLPGSIVIDLNRGDSGLPTSAQYQLILRSQQSGERIAYQLTAEDNVVIDDLNPDDYQLWIEFADAYQPIDLPRVITVTDSQPFELSFVVKPSVDLEKLSLIDGVQITKVVDGVFQARQMAWGDGYLFVGSSAISEEQGARGNKIYAIPYDYQTGQVGEPLVVADNLLEPHGVAYRNGTLYFATSMSLFRIEDVVSKLGKSLEAEKVLTLPAGDDNFPLYEDPVGLYWHQKHTLKFNSFDPSDENLYISIGSPCNICVIQEEPKYGSILKVDTSNFSSVQIADGIRNTVGFDWDPQRGDLWFTDNNPQNTDGHTTYFPGEINKISAQQLASGTMPHFGFPYVSGIDTISITPEQQDGTAESTGGYDYIPPGAIYSDILIEDINPADFQAPEFELEAGSAPLGMVFWQPDGVQPDNGERSFVYATHGPGDGERAGYEVRMLTLDTDGTPLFDRALITGWKQPTGISGKPVELLVMPDNSLLVSDDAGNTIYRLDYLPEVSGQISLSPSQGEIEDPRAMVQATLTDSDGVSRRLYMSLTQPGYAISGLDYGIYTLAIPSHSDVEPTETIIEFTLSASNPSEDLQWSYSNDTGGDRPTGLLSVNVPAEPSNAASSVLLALESKDSSDVVYIDAEWGQSAHKVMDVGSYQVDLPYTESAIPNPQRQDVNLSENGYGLSWSYTEYESDEDYFNAMMESYCSACHGGTAPDLTEGPSSGMIKDYIEDPNAIADKIAQMIDFADIPCDSACQTTLARYLEDELWADELPDNGNTEAFGSRHLRLLTKVEYVNTVRDLFGVQVDPKLLPNDDRSSEESLYGNPGKLGYLTSDKMSAYLDAAVYVQDNLDVYAISQCEPGGGVIPEWVSTQVYGANGAKELVVHESDVYQAMYWSQGSPPAQNNGDYGQPWKFIEEYIEGDADCLENWYTATLERMLRRPVTEDDLALYPATHVEKQLATLLVSPHFLYRREAGLANTDGRYHLTAHELATLVSYTLVGSIPDVELWSKANDGSLQQASVLQQQIDRLLNQPQAYEQFAQFMMQTMEFDEDRVAIERDGLSVEVGEAMLEEFKIYIRETVFGVELGRFSDLMAHDKTYVNQQLANHYGFSGAFNTSFSETVIPQERGKGLLSLGAIAVAYSTEAKTRLIPRGRMVQHSLLGWDQALASGVAPDYIEDDTSTKDYWTKATGPDTECWVCHQKMNDIGFAYDVLDKTGRYRAYENYVSLNGEEFNDVLLETHGELVDVDSMNTSFDDLKDIALYLSDSQESRQAFVRNYLFYTLGEASNRFSPLYPEYASFEQFKVLMRDLLMSTTVSEREE
ncbi:PKD domain-containing protein [Vibrio coralliilyticus]|nr:DUF1592 domain-containing protein [Vibrio coralliilyticus]MCC2521544.1 DUF1592 domain-containing protein [Vibrio coralliilyticus]